MAPLMICTAGIRANRSRRDADSGCWRCKDVQGAKWRPILR